ncbi:MAG: PocR ligand-binding domain-containing protein, partial [Treponema sp.]|nr:PocR ligand-binding domain-containing protein [Treponema sp.]
MKELMTVNSGNATIIDRREIKPLLVKACRLMSFYEKAMGCPALVLDKAGSSIQSIEQRQTPFCEACSNSFSKDHVKWTLAEHPCIHMHKEALTYPSRGDVYIYTCKAGFSYWTSPIYSGGRYAGSISAGQVMAAADINVIERINSIEGMPAEKLMDMLSAVPLKKPEEIQAMAKLLSLCAR